MKLDAHVTVTIYPDFNMTQYCVSLSDGGLFMAYKLFVYDI